MGGWIGVDLDGTLAEYTEWKGPDHIGKPIPKMVERVRNWVFEGKDVRIFTARVCEGERRQIAPVGDLVVREAIQNWCKSNLGFILPITCMKDYGMIELWDDRCVQIIPNTGERADGVKDE